ncbi:hypothetical protein [Haliovirga abyssi]|uniref:Uncharacterized protein n=1 Tax=Haliovirga abyssi TaxID=2996794 RepID=A0AAU9E0N1_9FUSO|nr:hypothetical protein [Haliovirga abyssi]BDU51470.1 hypothetical protein HLVA_20390 [Haliovirga abyssi]
MKKKLIVAILFFSFALISFGEENFDFIGLDINSSQSGYNEEKSNWEISGSLRNTNIVEIEKSGKINLSELKLYSELKKKDLFISLETLFDNRKNPSLDLKELYYDYVNDVFSIRIGRQIIEWGVVDGAQIVDIINPVNLVSGYSFEYNDLKVPVNAIKVDILKNSSELNFIIIPVSPVSNLEIDNQKYNVITPSVNLKNIEVGVKYKKYLGTTEISLMAFKGINDFPIYDKINKKVTFGKEKMLGMDFSKKIGSMVLRGETGYFFEKSFEKVGLNGSNGAIEKDYIGYALVCEFNFGNSLGGSLAFGGDRIFNYNDSISRKKEEPFLISSFSKTIFNDLLTMSMSGYINLSSEVWEITPMVKYSINDNINFETGISIKQENTKLSLKTTYNF